MLILQVYELLFQNRKFIVVAKFSEISRNVINVGERSNFKKIPTHMQDHGDGIATRGESAVHVPS